ncbi:MAG TPA: protein kinase [Polyangiales bacterium]|nr:protein kinase [Polyangiales bacterium]
MSRADFPDALRSLLRHQPDLRSRCLQASLQHRMFGRAGTVELAGTQFSVLRRLGAGAMGVVYEVERTGHAGRLALKLLNLSGGEQAYRLKREFRMLSQLGHPNLVTLHELFADAEGCAFTMELVRGSELARYVRPAGRLDLERLRDVVVQLADGLAFLHEQGVVHRDLKPSNLLIDEQGRAVLLDFGVALSGPEHDVSGTERYMAPEQRCGRTVPASDLYALGVMLQQLLEAEDGHAAWRALAHELCSAEQTARPTARELLARLRASPRPAAVSGSAFVGRKLELARLHELAARRGRPRFAHIEGPSGQGKSALIAELARQLAAEPKRWLLLGRCCRRESVRYRALDPLIDALSDALLSAEAALVERLAQCVTGHLLELFPVLERIPPFAERKAAGGVLADPRERRSAAVAALRALLSALEVECELCLSIDDVHWLDAESLEMMRELIVAPDAPALLWLCAGRADESRELEQLLGALPAHDVCRIQLQTLPAEDAEALARALFPARPDVWAWTFERSGGNPFLLSQLGMLALDSQAGDEPALERILLRRLAALPEPARQLLELVALSSQPLSVDLLCECARRSRTELDGALHLLEGQRYLRTLPGAALCVEPYHDRIGELASSAVPDAAREGLHLRIAEALERAPDAQHATSLLFHFRHAGRTAKALRYGKLAARRAQARLSFHEAAALFGECCELASDAQERASLSRARAVALIDAGRDREAGVILRELSEAALRRSERLTLVCAAADLFFRAGYRDDAMQLLEPWLRALNLAPRRTRAGQFASFVWQRVLLALPALPGKASAERIELSLLLANGLSRFEILNSLDYASRLLVLVRRGATVEQRVRALLFDAAIHANVKPSSRRAARLLERARRACAGVDDPLLHARVSAAAAAVAGLSADRPGMASAARRAVELFEAHGRGVQMELTEARCMWLISEFGAGRPIQRELLQIVRDAVQRGDRFSEAGARMYLATALLAAGEPARMREEVDRALQLVAAEEHLAIYWVAAGQRARAELFEGNAASAYRRLGAALRRMRPHGFLLVPWMRIELRYLYALAAAQARGARALPEVAAVARRLRAERLAWPRLLAGQLEGWMLAARGQRERAARHLVANAQAIDAYGGGAWYAAGSRLLASQLHGEGGSELLAQLRARGVPEPRSFLASYAPLLERGER